MDFHVACFSADIHVSQRINLDEFGGSVTLRFFKIFFKKNKKDKDKTKKFLAKGLFQNSVL